MVPMTTKAFFGGTLQPTVDVKGRELILLKVSGEDFVEMDCQEVSDALQKRIDPSVSEDEKKEKKKAATKSVVVPKATTVTAKAGLPFFEIREEYDEKGREIRAEAINVEEQLKYLESKEGKRLDSNKPSLLVHGVGEDHQLEEEGDVVGSHQQVSESDYAAIVSRLDELAILEEEGEANRIINQRSAKKLQGSGWAKGFLTAKKPSKKKANKTAKIVRPTSRQQGEAGSSPNVGNPRKVGFNEKGNEIREIPRVGTQAASSGRKPRTTETSLRGSRPFEPEVFSGVIRERVGERPQGDETQSRTKQRTSRFAAARKDQPKKVSRFVRERQQER